MLGYTIRHPEAFRLPRHRRNIHIYRAKRRDRLYRIPSVININTLESVGVGKVVWGSEEDWGALASKYSPVRRNREEPQGFLEIQLIMRPPPRLLSL